MCVSNCVVASTVNASPFVISGEAFFLNSPSDYVRLSLSAERVFKPVCIVELREDDALKMQLEPDIDESPPQESAADVNVVVAEEDQAPPSDRFDDTQRRWVGQSKVVLSHLAATERLQFYLSNFYFDPSTRGCEVLRSACMFVSLSVCVCLLAYLKSHVSKVHKIFFTCYLWPWAREP